MNNKLLFAIIGVIICSISLASCKQASQLAGKTPVGNTVNSATKDAGKVVDAGTKLVETFNKMAAKFDDMSIKDERAMGESVVLQVYTSESLGKPIKHPKLMKFMNVMTNVIAQNSERPMIPYHIAIVEHKEFNAFAAPGGYIFITTGLIMELDNEAELAMVIGHEVGHIAKKHAVQAMKGNPYMAAAGEAMEGLGDFTAANFSANIGQFGKLVDGLTDGLLGSFNQYDPSIEYEADEIGMACSLNTGYDPRAMLDVFAKLKKYYPANSDTHPSLEQRLSEIKAYLNKLDNEDLEGLKKETGRMAKIKAWIEESRNGDVEGWQ